MKQKMKQAIAMMAVAVFTLVSIASCKKNNNGKYSNAPRTNPMPEFLTSDWAATNSGGGYIYNGHTYGTSGKGVEIRMKADGTGWWNEIERVATPGCVLSTNLSIDCTFEMHNDGSHHQIYVYVTGGEYHGQNCSGTTDKILGTDLIYPKYPPMKYYYTVVPADGNPALRLLLLSQQENETKRFVAGVDDKMIVLKEQ